MIKLIFFFIIFSVCFNFVSANTQYDEFNWARSYDKAVSDNKADDISKSSKTSSPSWWSNSIKVNVTEYVPWAWCVCKKKADKWTGCLQYTCTIQPWMTTVQMILWQIIKWLTAIAALAWVLFIVVNGILLSMHWWEKEKIKTRITTTITWLILLLLSWVILSVIAPWVYK